MALAAVLILGTAGIPAFADESPAQDEQFVNLKVNTYYTYTDESGKQVSEPKGKNFTDIPIGSSGSIIVEISTSGRDLKGGVLTLSNYVAPVALSTALSKLKQNNPTSIKTLTTDSKTSKATISLYDLPAGAQLKFEIPFTHTKLNAQKNKEFIKSQIDVTLTGTTSEPVAGGSQSAVVMSETLNFLFTFKPLLFAPKAGSSLDPAKMTYSIYKNLEETNLIIKYNYAFQNANWQDSQGYSKYTIKNNFEKLFGAYPTEVRFSSATYFGTSVPELSYNPATGEMILSFVPAAGTFTFTASNEKPSCSILAIYPRPTQSQIDSAPGKKLANRAVADIVGYSYSAETTDTAVSKEMFTEIPYSSLTGTLFTFLSKPVVEYDYYSARYLRKFPCVAYTLFSYSDSATLGEVRRQEIKFTDVMVSYKGESGFKPVSSDMYTVKSCEVKNIAAGNEVYVMHGAEKLATLTLSSNVYANAGGFRISELSFVPKNPMNMYETDGGVYVSFDLNDKFIKYIEDNNLSPDQMTMPVSLTVWANGDPDDTPTIKDRPGENNRFTCNFLYSSLGHTFGRPADSSKTIGSKPQTFTFRISYPHSNPVGNVTNTTFYVFVPKAVEISNVRPSGISPAIGETNFRYNISVKKLLDDSKAEIGALITFSSKDPAFMYYNPRITGYQHCLTFDVDMTALESTNSAELTVESYGFCNEGVYDTNPAQDIRDVNGNKSKTDICSRSDMKVSVFKPAGTLISVRAAGGSQTSVNETPIVIDRDGEFVFSVPYLNNWSKPLSNVNFLIKLPHRGSVDVAGRDLGSDTDAYLTDKLKLPARFSGADVYYSEELNPGYDPAASGGSWSKTPGDLTKITSVLICLNSYVIQMGEYIGDFNFNMRVADNAKSDGYAYGMAQMFYDDADGRSSSATTRTGIYVPHYDLSLKNIVLNAAGGELTAQQSDNQVFSYTITHTDSGKTYSADLTADGMAVFEDVTSGEYTVARDAVFNYHDAIYEPGAAVTLDYNVRRGDLTAINKQIKNIPILYRFITVGDNVDYRSEIDSASEPGTTIETLNAEIARVNEDNTITGASVGSTLLLYKSEDGQLIGKVYLGVIEREMIDVTVRYVGDDGELLGGGTVGTFAEKTVIDVGDSISFPAFSGYIDPVVVTPGTKMMKITKTDKEIVVMYRAVYPVKILYQTLNGADIKPELEEATGQVYPDTEGHYPAGGHGFTGAIPTAAGFKFESASSVTNITISKNGANEIILKYSREPMALGAVKYVLASGGEYVELDERAVIAEAGENYSYNYAPTEKISGDPTLIFVKMEHNKTDYAVTDTVIIPQISGSADKNIIYVVFRREPQNVTLRFMSRDGRTVMPDKIFDKTRDGGDILAGSTFKFGPLMYNQIVNEHIDSLSLRTPEEKYNEEYLIRQGWLLDSANGGLNQELRVATDHRQNVITVFYEPHMTDVYVIHRKVAGDVLEQSGPIRQQVGTVFSATVKTFKDPKTNSDLKYVGESTEKKIVVADDLPQIAPGGGNIYTLIQRGVSGNIYAVFNAASGATSFETMHSGGAALVTAVGYLSASQNTGNVISADVLRVINRFLPYQVSF